MTNEDVIDTWTVQIVSDSGDLDGLIRLRANLPAYMEEAEENLTDRLPEGYRAIVKEWNAEPEPKTEAELEELGHERWRSSDD